MELKLEALVAKLKDKGFSPEVKQFPDIEGEKLVEWDDDSQRYYDVWFDKKGLVQIYSGMPGDFDFVAKRGSRGLCVRYYPEASRYQRIEKEFKGLGIELV